MDSIGPLLNNYVLKMSNELKSSSVYVLVALVVLTFILIIDRYEKSTRHSIPFLFRVHLLENH